jgi:hypothetical protein
MMKTLFRKFSAQWLVTNAFRVTVCFITLASAPLALGQPPANPASIEEEHPTAHVTDHEEMTWPPQPEGIKNPVLLSNPAMQTTERNAKLHREEAIDQVVRVSPDVRQALGTRFTRIKMVEGQSKDASQHHTRMVYFSRSNNSTVEVDLEGEKVLAVKTKPAGQYQPELTKEEITEAVEIARTYFISQGQNRVTTLDGYGILGYTKDGKFFENRVVYVSFHENREAPPEFEAWVNLTDKSVIRSREEHL